MTRIKRITGASLVTLAIALPSTMQEANAYYYGHGYGSGIYIGAPYYPAYPTYYAPPPYAYAPPPPYAYPPQPYPYAVPAAYPAPVVAPIGIGVGLHIR